MEDWLDGKLHDVTEEHMALPWNGSPKNFRCYLCGHKFKVGDRFGFLVTREVGNFMFCHQCYEEDKAELIAKWKAVKEEWKKVKQRYWWFLNDSYFEN